MTATASSPIEAGHPAAEFDGGDLDCGSGLLLSLVAAMRRIQYGEVLLLRTREASVVADLPAWARLSGHDLLSTGGGDLGPWHLLIRRGRAASRPAQGFSQGASVPLGSRLWLYSNFHCNLACGYCCASSSPRAAARLMPVDLAVAAACEHRDQGGRELLVTGGEPFLHPDLGDLLGQTSALMPVTVLTNAMLFRGERLATLDSLDRSAVTVQVSLDSAGPELHDRQRGAGSHARALEGIGRARDLGFTVRVAATLQPQDLTYAQDLHAALEALGIPAEDRLVRPVAHEGFASDGLHVSLDTVEPEPTLTVDGAWWHPVAVTNPHLKVADSPLPLEHVLDVMRDVVAVQEAGEAQGRSVFRCT